MVILIALEYVLRMKTQEQLAIEARDYMCCAVISNDDYYDEPTQARALEVMAAIKHNRPYDMEWLYDC